MPHLKKRIKKRTCICCGSAMDFLYTIRRFDPDYDMLRCPSCGLQCRSEWPEDPNSYYNAEYYDGRASFAYRDERRNLKYDDYVFRARLKSIARFVPPAADFLDVGCAFGGFTAAASRAGYRARGLDVSSYAAAEGEKRGIDITCGELKPGIFPERSFDVVSMVEVIEHLADPEIALAVLRDLIRPGGLLLIQTADFGGRQAKKAGIDYHYYLPGHLYCYSAENLQRLLSRYGFERTKLFRPVDFGLLPKLLKSRGSFRRLRDYKNWLRIALYHGTGKIAWKNFALSSSMVLYAFRDMD